MLGEAVTMLPFSPSSLLFFSANSSEPHPAMGLQPTVSPDTGQEAETSRLSSNLQSPISQKTPPHKS